MMSTEPITIMLVDDHDLVRMGLRLSLEQTPEFKIVGEASNGRSAVTQAIDLRPNVVLMDIGMPEMDGIEATERIKSAVPGSHVIMLTSHDRDKDIGASLGAGADGFCRKDVTIEELIDAVRTVRTGSRWFDPRVMRRAPGIRVEAAIDSAPQASLLEEKILLPGTIFARKYAIESIISMGGMGTVYKARHLAIDRVVALKVLKEDLAVEPSVVRCFRQEAQAASSLYHPNVISVFDFGVCESGQPFLIMDYLEGRDLSDVIAAEGALPLKRFLRIFGQVCDGLSAAHARSIIHCDLKPGNIMLVDSRDGEEDHVKIVDFGLAKIVPRAPGVQMQMTDRFQVLGSPLFMSPEQCLGQKLDFRSDIYALGCAMYNAITGHSVFDSDTSFETLCNQLHLRPKSFAAVCPQRIIPMYLEAIIFRAMNKDPDHRYQTVSALKADLSDVPMTAQVRGEQFYA